MCFTSLYHHVTDEGNLYASYWDLEPGKAPGIDGVRKEGYEAELDKNITDLAQRLRRLGYRPRPARRVYIPKPGSGKKRPLGIPCFEDKLVQRVVARVLEQIYEEDFLDCSYGYRPGRTCHEALGELGRTIQRKKVSYVVEADIRGFLDASSYYTPSDGFGSKREGMVAGTLIRKPLRRPRFTWTASSSPRFTRCNTVWRETPRMCVASSIGRYPSGACSTKRERSSSVMRMRHGAPGVSCSAAMKPSFNHRWTVEGATPSMSAALCILTNSPSGEAEDGAASKRGMPQ